MTEINKSNPCLQEDTHLSDLEMRREHGTTAQLSRLDDHGTVRKHRLNI